MLSYGIILYPGSNGDYDLFYILKYILKYNVEIIYWYERRNLSYFDLILIPGGFAYGDYLRPGIISSLCKISKDIKKYASNGGKIIGICNGFQILTEMKLLPGILLRNKRTNFICKHIYIKIENKENFFTQFIKLSFLKLPIAHSNGNYYCDKETYNTLEKNKQIVFKYSNSLGEITQEANINGSLFNIAGILNKEKNILGIMPHPERAFEDILYSSDGKKFFKAIEKSIKIKKIE